jgi:hypothetical protein
LKGNPNQRRLKIDAAARPFMLQAAGAWILMLQATGARNLMLQAVGTGT